MAKQFNWFVFGRSTGKAPYQKISHGRGYTLAEMLLVLLVVTALVAISVSVWPDLLASRHQALQRNALLQSIRFARTAAVMQGRTVTLCGSADGRHCDGRWSDGCLIVASPHDVLRYRHYSIQAVRISWRGGFGVRDHLKFGPSGFTLGQQGRFYLCAKPTLRQPNQAVVVSVAGRARVEETPQIDRECLQSWDSI